MIAHAKPVGPVIDQTAALTSATAALAALRASQCYRQYLKNGTLKTTKLGECERDLLAVIRMLGG